MNRRAQLDVQFNWIFVLVAGAVILGLFFKVAATQRQLSEDKSAIRLQNDFDTIYTAALQSKDTVQTVQVPGIGLNFDCSDCSCAIKFGRFSLPFNDRSIFTPNVIDGPEVKLWTVDWKIPFRATNFLFVTNDFVKFVLVGQDSDPLLQRIQAAMPTEILAEVVDINDVDDVRPEGARRVVFVFFNTDPNLGKPNIPAFSKIDTRAVEVRDDGSLNFFVFKRGAWAEDAAKDGLGGPAYFLGDEMVLGAMMAQDREAYTCNIQTAFKRLDGVTQVYAKRVGQLLASPVPAACQALYTAAYLESGSSCNDVDSPSFIGGPLGALDVVSKGVIAQEEGCNVILLKDWVEKLSVANEQLLRYSCPTVY